jgi:diguanylate cyclase (GGDEF)-like protein
VDKLSSPRERAALFLACVALIAAIGYVDFITGIAVRVFPLYFVPIGIGGWRLSRAAAVVLALFATVSWELANTLVDVHAIAHWVWVMNTITQLVAFLFAAFLISELRQRLDAEAALSRTDPLTSLANSRGFFERAAAILALARRTRLPVALAYIDLDNFKKVNDVHGHKAGDDALKLAADVLRTSTRESDVVGRLGGDEFATLLPNTDVDGARLVLERVRGRVAEAMRGNDWPVTTSIGAVVFPVAPGSVDEAVKAADQLMYDVKAAGKDRVEVEASAPTQRPLQSASSG